MARIVFTLFFVSVLSVAAFSQGKDNSLKGAPLKDRIVTGGGFGLGFGSVQDFLSISPMIGYRLTTKLLAGTGATYRYTKYKADRPFVTLNDYGLNPFLRFTFYRNIFLQTEYEYLNYENPIQHSAETTRREFNSFLAGGGFVQPIGRRASAYLMLMYNFSYQETAAYSPYDSPIVVRAGVNIGALSL